MAISIKALLLKKEETFGNGVASIRKLEDQMVDISDYEPGISDATATTNPHYIIKDDIPYKVIKTYFDLDRNARIFLCVEWKETFDVIPEEKVEEVVKEVENPEEEKVEEPVNQETK